MLEFVIGSCKQFESKLCFTLLLLLLIRPLRLLFELAVVRPIQLNLGKHEEGNDERKRAKRRPNNEYRPESLPVGGDENISDLVRLGFGDGAQVCLRIPQESFPLGIINV